MDSSDHLCAIKGKVFGTDLHIGAYTSSDHVLPLHLLKHFREYSIVLEQDWTIICTAVLTGTPDSDLLSCPEFSSAG